MVRQAHHPERSRRGIQETSEKSNHSGSRLASRSAGFGRDDELSQSLSRGEAKLMLVDGVDKEEANSGT